MSTNAGPPPPGPSAYDPVVLLSQITRRYPFVRFIWIAVVPLVVIAIGVTLSLPIPVTVFAAIASGALLANLFLAFQVTHLPKTRIAWIAYLFLWFSVLLFSAVLVLMATSVFFDYPLPWRAWVTPSTVPLALAPAPLNLRLHIRPARTYFAEATEPLKRQPNGSSEIAKRVLIKAALKALNGAAPEWHSVVLECRPGIDRATEGGTFVLNVNNLEQHSVSYSRTEPPLVQFFGWIERSPNGSLEIVPFAIDRDTSGTAYKLLLQIPRLQPKDVIVAAVERRPKAKPETFETGSTLEVIKK